VTTVRVRVRHAHLLCVTFRLRSRASRATPGGTLRSRLWLASSRRSSLQQHRLGGSRHSRLLASDSERSARRLLMLSGSCRICACAQPMVCVSACLVTAL
jgi:hypothetical protein